MTDKQVTRRGFVRRTAMGVGAGAVASTAGSNVLTGTESESGNAASEKRRRGDGRVSRRQVWVASLCQHKIDAATLQENIRKILHRMEEVLPMQPDVICLPECFHVAGMSGPRPPLSETAEQPIGDISRPFAEFARRNRCNVICPIYTHEAGRFYNAAVVIDRDGGYVGEYRKINKLDEVRRRYGRQVNVKIKHVEAWGMLESLSPDVSIAQVLREFDLETSSQVLARNTQLQDARRPAAGAS